jgi:hypothetical protein
VGVLNPRTGKGEQIFGPLLTPSKRQALESIQMGPITKYSLEFKECVWRDPPLTVLSNPTDRARTVFSSFPDSPNGPFVLTGLLMGTDHEWIDALSDKEAPEAFFREIEKIYNPDPSRPWRLEDKLIGTTRAGRFVPNAHRQVWSGKDPYTFGANSFIAVTPTSVAVPELRELLKSPLETLPLFWAGEATAPAYDRDYQPLAVHGAYISGVEVARDVASYLGGGLSPRRFAAYYRRKYRDVAAPLPPVPTTPPVSVRLGDRELRVLRVYARRAMEDDLPAAARELVEMAIRTVLGPDGSTPPRRRSRRRLRRGPTALVVRFPLARDLDRRLDAYARRHHAGDHARAAEAVLIGVLRWLGQQPGRNERSRGRRHGPTVGRPRDRAGGRRRPSRG